MGIFDPPAVSIRKKLPQHAQPDYADLSGKVECMVPPFLNRTESSMVVAIVMGVWVASENRAGRIELDHYNGRYIQNMVGNCRQRLGDLREVAEGIAEQLRIAGVISPPPE